MTALEQKIKEVLKGPQLAVLATMTEEGKPWARYVMAVADDELKIRFCTFLNSRKVAQLRASPEAHLTCGVTVPEETNSYIQVAARAEITTDEAERHAFWDDHLKTYFSGPDDPQYAIVILTPYRIEYMPAGKMEPEVWEG